MERLERFRKDIWPPLLFLFFVAVFIFFIWVAITENQRENRQNGQTPKIEKKTEASPR